MACTFQAILHRHQADRSFRAGAYGRSRQAYDLGQRLELQILSLLNINNSYMLDEISLFMFLLASISGGIAGVLIVKIVERVLRSIKNNSGNMYKLKN
jgi:hypothetical protein